MQPEVQALLDRHVYPRLDLLDVQALRRTCRAFRHAIGAVTADTWVTVAKSTLAEDHPLCCTAPQGPGPVRADHLARLHTQLHTGTVAREVAQLVLPGHGGLSIEGLRATPSPQGTLVISEAEYQLYVHELRLAPRVGLHQVAKLPSPQPKPEAEPGQERYVVAAWASDASAVLLQYQDTLPNHWAPKYQAVYVLEIPRWALTKVMHMTGAAAGLVMYSATWSPDSLITVPYKDCSGCFCRVHKRDGQIVADFQVPELLLQGGRRPSLAYAMRNRLAIARQDDFGVWQLPSGDLLDIIGPSVVPKATQAEVRCDSTVAANPPGTKLAFFAARTRRLHLYNARTLSPLETMGLLSPAGRAGILPQDSQRFGMVWDVYGWMLLSGPWSPYEDDKLAMLHLYKARSDGRYALTLRHEHQPAQLPASSPDGAFVCLCVCKSRAATIKVFNTRTGQLVLSKLTELPDGVLCHAIHHAIHWSSCGSHIMVRLYAFDCSIPSGMTDRLLVFCFVA